MTGEWSISWAWWITAVEVPILGCLFWLIHHGRRETEQTLLKIYREIQANLSLVQDRLAQSELEVAKQYATIDDLQAVERRLTDHLLRLENRLTFMLEAGQRRGIPWPYVAVERGHPETDVDAD